MRESNHKNNADDPDAAQKIPSAHDAERKYLNIIQKLEVCRLREQILVVPCTAV